MTRLAFAFAFVVGIGMTGGCGTETLPPVAEPSTENIATAEPETLAEEQVGTLDSFCVVPRARFEELQDRLGIQFGVDERWLAVWSPDGTRVRFSPNDDTRVRIPCDSELRARIESLL